MAVASSNLILNLGRDRIDSPPPVDDRTETGVTKVCPLASGGGQSSAHRSPLQTIGRSVFARNV